MLQHPNPPASRLLEQPGASAIFAELQPIIDAISASFRERDLTRKLDVSVTVPVTEGRTLVVSVRTGGPRREPLPRASTRGLEARQLTRVIEAIHEKIGERISVSTLSSIAGLSRSHFSHAFRASVGRAPHEQIVRMRIEHAMKLMAGTDVSLSEIALAAGFSDQAHFSNNFRRTIGTTPRLWRRAHQS